MRRWLKAEDCWAHLGRAFQSIILFPREQADHDVCRTISRPGRTCWNSLRCSTSLPAPESPDAKQNQEANVFTWNSRLVWQFGEILLGWAADHWRLITWTGIQSHLAVRVALQLPWIYLSWHPPGLRSSASSHGKWCRPTQTVPEKVHAVSVSRKLLYLLCLRRSLSDLSVSLGINSDHFSVSILYISWRRITMPFCSISFPTPTLLRLSLFSDVFSSLIRPVPDLESAISIFKNSLLGWAAEL